jgi:hypothetical protein
MSRIELFKVRVDLSILASSVLNGFREREPGRAAVLDTQPELRVYGDPSLLRLHTLAIDKPLHNVNFLDDRGFASRSLFGSVHISGLQ